MKIINVVGARPNFMKVAPIHKAFQNKGGIDSIILHTGQHYDEKMSDIFFRQLELPEPDIYLGIGGGSHAEQTGKIMIAFEKVVKTERPDLILVVGDVNSTVACSLVGAKCHVPVAHVEAGLRSGDRRMPEEINRIVTDSIADLLFVTEQSGIDHLHSEGIDSEKIHFVGNVMIDSLISFRDKANRYNMIDHLRLNKGEYVLMTMHRPSNVDHLEGLQELKRIIASLASYKKVLFPMHPRTKKNLQQHDLYETVKKIPNLTVTDPLGYLEFLNLMDHAALIVTDSGGIQEEATYLRVPCLTLRENTERPVTIELGTNELIPVKAQFVMEKAGEIFNSYSKKNEIPPFWDGKAAERIVHVISHYLNENETTRILAEGFKNLVDPESKVQV